MKTLSLQTVRHCLKLLRGALAAAVDEELISANPALGIKLPKENRTDEGWTVLSTDELARVLEAAPIPERHMNRGCNVDRAATRRALRAGIERRSPRHGDATHRRQVWRAGPQADQKREAAHHPTRASVPSKR